MFFLLFFLGKNFFYELANCIFGMVISIYFFSQMKNHRKLSVRFVCDSPYCDELDKFPFLFSCTTTIGKRIIQMRLKCLRHIDRKTSALAEGFSCDKHFLFLVGFSLKPRR